MRRHYFSQKQALLICFTLSFFLLPAISLATCCTELLSSCPYGNVDGNSCNNVSIGSYCEGDGECGTDNNANNCNVWDWYKRVCCDNGVSCSVDGDCCSGNCVDGYCCDSACNGACEACNVAGHEGTCTDDHSLCSGTISSCYCSGGVCQPCTDPGGCSYATCIGHTCGTADYGTSHECNSAWKCSTSTGDGNYGVGSGNYKCQGYCDGSGNCDYAGNCYNCNDDNYYYCETGNNKYYQDYDCSGGTCVKDTPSFRKDCDDYDDDNCWLVCDTGTGDIDRWCDDWYCNSGTCKDSGNNWLRDNPYSDCSDTASDNDGGDKPKTSGTCTDYELCTSGDTSCPSTDYPDNCASTTHLEEYYPYSNDCTSKDYYCSDFEVAATDSYGDDPTYTETCYGGIGASCSSNQFVTSSQSDFTDHCTGTCGTGIDSCYFIEYYPADSGDACSGNDYCKPKNYDADHESNTCNACGLNWNLDCSFGDCSPSESSSKEVGTTYTYNYCCGDDASEYAITCSCNLNSCSSDSTDACCANSDDCVWAGGCYLNGNTTDIDSDGIDEYCKGNENKWYAYPNITSISIDKSPIDRDDEVDKFTPDTEIKITAEIYDQDNNDRDKVYITIYEPDGVTIAKDQSGTSINSKLMICSDTNSNHWSCYYNYNPEDGSPIRDYDVKIKAVDNEGLEDTKTESNLFKVEDIYLTNMNHYGTTKDLHITGTAKYTTYDTTVSGANVKCYAEDKICSTTTDGGGNFDCNIGELNKNFAQYNTIKTNTFICEVMDIYNIAGSRTYNITIGLRATTHTWNDTTLYHDETVSFNVTFKNVGDLTFAMDDLYWEISSENGTNPEINEDCHNTGWVDACGYLGKYEGDPHNSCGCYIQFDQNLVPGNTVTYSGSWKAKYHEFGDYNFSVWVEFPDNETGFTNIVAGQKIKTIKILDKSPVNLTFMFALPSPVDRDKETSKTNDNITIRVNATDYVDGVLGDNDELEQYSTIWVKSDQNNNWMICENVTMNQIPYHNAYYYGNCTWNPPNDMSDVDLGNFSVKFKVLGYGSYHDIVGEGYNISDYSENTDKFVVEDIDISNIAWSFGNTTDLIFIGNATYLSNNLRINNITNQTCSQPIILDIPDGNENTRENINPPDSRLCGINSFAQDITCTVINGNFSCYVRNIKLNDTTVTFSYILTDEKNISGNEDLTINLNGTIDDFINISDPDGFVNIYQPINYTINFSNTGNIGWFGEISNQTRIKIYSPAGENPVIPSQEHISLDCDNNSSWVNLMNGTTSNFSHFLGHSYYVLGKYNYITNLSYFWSDSLHSINFSITTGGKTNYTVAAIDITDYNLPNKVVRGNQIIGKAKGYFVGSMDIGYWEEIQGDAFKVTNNTTNAIYWVEKWNKTSKIGTEIPETNMTWNPGFWEGKINTFDLSCDDETTVHRVYFLINWTDFNIYTPYVKGEFKSEFWPYFYQNLSVICTSRELFEVNPEITNVALGTENRDIYNIFIENPSDSPVDINLTINCDDYPDAVNWVNENHWTIHIPAESSTSRIVTLDEAPRVGNYEFSVSVRGDLRYDKKVWLNIFSEALGSDSLVYLLLLFFMTSILLIKRKL